MNRAGLINEIKSKRSFLCVGLDTDRNKLPAFIKNKENDIVHFNQSIIKATEPYSVSYKINTAFYEQYGAKGWEMMEQTLGSIPTNCFTIADAKRGDIGNTSNMYAKAFFETLCFDAVTVAPYMGEDSLRPFLEFKNKWVIVLALTSNTGSNDFQHLKTENGLKLYENVINSVCKWGNEENLMFVVGATRAEHLQSIRKHIPEHFLLVPGVGAQGGSLEDVARYGQNTDVGLLVNSSRGIIYAGSDEDFDKKAAEAAKEMQSAMSHLLL